MSSSMYTFLCISFNFPALAAVYAIQLGIFIQFNLFLVRQEVIDFLSPFAGYNGFQYVQHPNSFLQCSHRNFLATGNIF